MAASFASLAPAKINLTLHIRGRRADGYHDLESLVAFTSFGDELSLEIGPAVTLAVRGPMAASAGPVQDNLVLRAARSLAERCDPLRLGHFTLTKHLPAGAGLGGGSSDAAAALRLLARANGLQLQDRRLFEAALVTGADVPVCVDPKPRIMQGIGEVLSDPVDLPALAIVVVYPDVPVPTAAVFKGLGLAAGEKRSRSSAGSDLTNALRSIARTTATRAAGRRSDRDKNGAQAEAASAENNRLHQGLLACLAGARNDLEPAAIAIAPRIAEALRLLAPLPGCRLARMSGSGSACFGLFEEAAAATAAAREIASLRPSWWTRAGELGGSAAISGSGRDGDLPGEAGRFSQA